MRRVASAALVLFTVQFVAPSAWAGWRLRLPASRTVRTPLTPAQQARNRRVGKTGAGSLARRLMPKASRFSWRRKSHTASPRQRETTKRRSSGFLWHMRKRPRVRARFSRMARGARKWINSWRRSWRRPGRRHGFRSNRRSSGWHGQRLFRSLQRLRAHEGPRLRIFAGSRGQGDLRRLWHMSQ